MMIAQKRHESYNINGLALETLSSDGRRSHGTSRHCTRPWWEVELDEPLPTGYAPSRPDSPSFHNGIKRAFERWDPCERARPLLNAARLELSSLGTARGGDAGVDGEECGQLTGLVLASWNDKTARGRAWWC